MDPGENLDPGFGPEPGHLLQLLLAGHGGQAQDGRVGVTQLVLLVDLGDRPTLIGKAKPLKLLSLIIDCPAIGAVAATLLLVGESKKLIVVGKWKCI